MSINNDQLQEPDEILKEWKIEVLPPEPTFDEMVETELWELETPQINITPDVTVVGGSEGRVRSATTTTTVTIPTITEDLVRFKLPPNYDNLPLVIRNSDRFFPVVLSWKNQRWDKHPVVEHWNKPESQMTLTAARSYNGNDYTYVGWDITDHLFIDMDHVLDKATGEFRSDEAGTKAKAFYEDLVAQFPGIYVERSVSGDGLHAFLKPSPEKFNKLSGSKNSVYFDKDGHCKAEFFVNTKGRYCLVTGCVYKGSGTEIPAGDAVDLYLCEQIPRLEKQQAKARAQATTTAEKQEKGRAGDSTVSNDDLNHDKAVAAILALYGLVLSYEDWLALCSACLALGLDEELDGYNHSDPRPDKYESLDDIQRRNLKLEGFDVSTIVGLAKQYAGFDASAFNKQWYSERGTNVTGGHRNSVGVDDFGSDNGNSDTSKRLDIIFCASKANDQGVCNVFVNAYRDRLKVLSDVSAPKSNKLVGLMVYKETTDIDPVTGEVYTGGVWCPADFKVLLNMVKKLAERLEKIAETELQKKIVDALNDARKIDRVLDLISGDDTLWIRSDKFDNHPELLNVANGVVNLNDGKLYPPDPGLLLTKQISIPYLPDEKCPVFDGFLASSIPNNDTRAYLLSLLGYCLDGEYTEQGVWIWSGSGGNGKGTCLNIVSEITGNYCSVLPMSLFTKGTVLNDPNKPSPVIAGLRNCRFAYAQENQPGDQWNVANVKTLSGGDQLPYTLKYSNEPQRIKNPQHTLILNVGQYKPDMFDAHDGGLGSRFFVIQWYQQFRNSKGDPNLKKKLMAELPGILAQLVHEAMLNRQRGNGSPKLRPVSAEMDCAKNGYFNANDWLAEFIDENYDTEEDPELQKPIPVSVVLKNIKAQLPDKIAVFGNSWKVEIKRMLAELGYEAEDGSHARQKVYKTLKYRSGR